MSIQTKNLTLYRGDTRVFRVGFDGGGLPFEPREAQWAMTVRGQTGEELRPQVSVSGREIIITFPAALTQNVAWANGQYDLRAIFGGIVSTVLKGDVYIAPSISNVSGFIGEATEPVRVSIMEQGLVVMASPTPSVETPKMLTAEEIRKIVETVVKENIGSAKQPTQPTQPSPTQPATGGTGNNAAATPTPVPTQPETGGTGNNAAAMPTPAPTQPATGGTGNNAAATPTPAPTQPATGGTGNNAAATDNSGVSDEALADILKDLGS